MEYKIIESSKRKDLEEQIDTYLNGLGFKLVGGIAVTPATIHHPKMYAQAVCKPSDRTE